MIVMPYENSICIPMEGRDQAFYHPHVNTDGGICWGNAQDTASRAIVAGQLDKVMNLLKSLLTIYNGGNPYRSFEEFREHKHPITQDLMWCISSLVNDQDEHHGRAEEWWFKPVEGNYYPEEQDNEHRLEVRLDGRRLRRSLRLGETTVEMADTDTPSAVPIVENPLRGFSVGTASTVPSAWEGISRSIMEEAGEEAAPEEATQSELRDAIRQLEERLEGELSGTNEPASDASDGNTSS